MAHQVKDLEDLQIQIQWQWKGQKKKAVLNSFDPQTRETKSYPVSTKIAEVLIKHGMSSGS